jgi:hypothetical protein
MGPASSLSSKQILFSKASFCLESPKLLSRSLHAEPQLIVWGHQGLGAPLLPVCSSWCSSSPSRKLAFSQASLTKLLAKIKTRYRKGRVSNSLSRAKWRNSHSSSTSSSRYDSPNSSSSSSRWSRCSLNSRCKIVLGRSSGKRLTQMSSRCLWVA